MPTTVRYEFGPFTLEPTSFRLTRDGSDVPLTPKAFELLALLVRERHRVLTKQELLDAVWPDTAVIENALTQRIKEIREALGDRAQEPIYIRTLPRIGFQFMGEVTETAAARPMAMERATPDGAPQSVTLEPAAATRSEVPVVGAEPVEQPIAGRRWKRPVLAAFAVVVTAAIAILMYETRQAVPAPEAATANRRVMLAILPFENLTGDPSQAYIGDGLTEEMIAELGRLDPARLGVIARTSVMTYRSTTKGVAEIARELNVDFVLEGSVRREAERVRIVAQLIRATDQTHVWAERYDRDLHGILSLQSEVARTIAQQTRTTLSVDAEKHIRNASRLLPPEALQAYLKGRFLLNQRTSNAIQQALEHFQRAIAVEPSYAQAYAGLADAHELMASYASAVPDESLKRGKAAALRAIELEPRLSEAYTSLGSIRANYEWSWKEAESAYARALDLNPSNVLAHKGYADLLSFLGRHDEAIAEARRALELDPLSLLMHANLGITYHRARRPDEALAQMEQTLRMDPNYMLGHLNLGLILSAKESYDAAAVAFEQASVYSPEYGDLRGLLGYAYARAGRRAEARAIGAELRGTAAARPMSAYVRAHYYLGLGDEEQAVSELERAYDERSWLVALLKVDPLLDDLRAHPRFVALLRRMRFPE
jgi:TolB-like protein/DNA-binding winged helix-turn-helix (wHTH) protein/tetratricopeptide (TPR) repeat protein